MGKIKIFCFGFGQVAKSFINKLAIEKINFELNITSRKDSGIVNFRNNKAHSFKFDNDNMDSTLTKKLEESDYILISIPPINGKDIVIENFKPYFKKLKNCKWITYLSATSVYGNHNGQWVSEESVTKPTSSNGIGRLNSENLWKKLSLEYNLPFQIFRLAGIYSNEFNILKRLQSGKVQIVDKKNHFFSRIHIEDIANVLFKSLNNFKKHEIFNICDDKPSSQKEIARYGVKLLKIEHPKFVELENLDSEMLKNFYKDSKKVNNKKMKNFFKYQLKYPTYKEGLDKIFNNII